jgi:DNA-binding MarR family transcriptional regulator/ribosomal protein S18 acetylase RimI-like enzyme
MATEQHVAAVRRFNRFYTRQIGVLNERLLASRFSLAEVRVLYELAHCDRPTAAELGKALTLDEGYLSRILRGFVRNGLVRREASAADGRRSLLSLTKKGAETFAGLDRLASVEIDRMLSGLAAGQRRRLVEAMHAITITLEPDQSVQREGYVLRAPRPGDLGWVVHRHGVLYAEEYAWDERFEALVAEIVAEFVAHFDPKRERCWIAERHGEVVGSVFLVKKSPAIAKLRLLYVEPSARGLGIGSRLVDECIRFAREAQYRQITLWTQSVLTAARHIYERAGFTLVSREPHRSFGHRLVAEVWQMRL